MGADESGAPCLHGDSLMLVSTSEGKAHFHECRHQRHELSVSHKQAIVTVRRTEEKDSSKGAMGPGSRQTLFLVLPYILSRTVHP